MSDTLNFDHLLPKRRTKWRRTGEPKTSDYYSNASIAVEIGVLKTNNQAETQIDCQKAFYFDGVWFRTQPKTLKQKSIKRPYAWRYYSIKDAAGVLAYTNKTPIKNA